MKVIARVTGYLFFFTVVSFATPISLSYTGDIVEVIDPTGLVSIGQKIDFSIEFDIEASTSYFANGVEYPLEDVVINNNMKIDYFQAMISGIDLFPDAPEYTTPSIVYHNGALFPDPESGSPEIRTSVLSKWNTGGSENDGDYWENQVTIYGAGNIGNWTQTTALWGREIMYDQRNNLYQYAKFRSNYIIPSPSTPVPEPSMLLMIIAGCASVLFLRTKTGKYLSRSTR